AMLSVAPPSGLAADPSDTHNLTWTFDSGAQASDYLSVGQTLVLTYTVPSTDGLAGDTQDVTVTINGTNDAPDIHLVVSGTADTAAATLTETNAGLSTSGTLTVTDADLADTVISSVLSVGTSGPLFPYTTLFRSAMLSVAPPSGLAADPSDTHNLTWTFDSG